MTDELLAEFESEIQSITLVPDEGGKFEVVVNDDLIYSKLATHRHAEPGEVVGLLKSKLQS